MAASVAGYDGIMIGEDVNNLAFAFVAPLRAYHHCGPALLHMNSMQDFAGVGLSKGCPRHILRRTHSSPCSSRTLQITGVRRAGCVHAIIPNSRTTVDGGPLAAFAHTALARNCRQPRTDIQSRSTLATGHCPLSFYA